MEEDSLAIIKAVLPKHWVVREYRPDYGLDLAIEVFEPLGDDEDVSESLGEHFFVQVKSVKSLVLEPLVVHPRMNVAKFPHELGSVSATPASLTIEVLKHRLDCPLLATVHAMGASVVVFLFLVALDVRRVFAVCLSDYVEKVILPLGSHQLDQETIGIHVPAVNEISDKADHASAMSLVRFFAKRAKLYSAFNLFAYQRHELAFCEDEAARRQMASHFCGLLNSLDIWNNVTWPILDDYKRWLEHLTSVLPNVPESEWFTNHPCPLFCPNWLPAGMSCESATDMQIQCFWNGLNVLSRNYEEICREWGLPTYMESLRMGTSLERRSEAKAE